MVEKNGNAILVSLKGQEVKGTAEHKVPFEVLCLANAPADQRDARAYLVLEGPGWRLRNWYVSRALNKRPAGAENVHVLTLEAFVAAANQDWL